MVLSYSIPHAFQGARDKDSFISFIEDKKWTDVETVPSWKDPSSPQMALVACFFKVHSIIGGCYNLITSSGILAGMTRFLKHVQLKKMVLFNHSQSQTRLESGSLPSCV